MSVRTQGGTSLPVKKTRIVNTAKKEPVKASRALKKTTSQGSTQAASAAKQAAQPTSSGQSATASGDDMDKITSGMKKIKINLITKSQKEAKERAHSEKSATPLGDENKPLLFETSPFASEALPPLPEVSQVESTGGVSPTQVLTPGVNNMKGTPTQEFDFSALSPDPRQVPLPASSPMAPPPNGSQTPDMFVSYQPEGPSPVAVPQQEPLKWLPPNTSTPTPMKRGDLPVFTATSAIPFALSRKMEGISNGGAFPGIKPEAKSQSSLWDVPETPQK
jgi:histone deacetylase HOS3